MEFLIRPIVPFLKMLTLVESGIVIVSTSGGEDVAEVALIRSKTLNFPR